MSNFVKVGKYRINLDQVSCVTETTEGVRVFYPHAVGDGYAYDDLRGDQAKLLLAIIDQDDEAVDEIYARMYHKAQPAAPVCALCAECGAMFTNGFFGKHYNVCDSCSRQMSYEELTAKIEAKTI